MCLPLRLNPDVVADYLRKSDDAGLAKYLKDSFVLQKDPDGVPIKYEFAEEALQSLHQILLTTTTKKRVKIELFRALRNYAINPEVRDYIIHGTFLNDVKCGTDPHFRRGILQFFINLSVKSRDASVKLYDLFRLDMLESLVTAPVYEASALLYNISLYRPLDRLGPGFYREILELIIESNGKGANSTEYLHFLVEKFLDYPNFWKRYPKFTIDQRMVVLQAIRDAQVRSDDALHLADVGLAVLAERFEKSSKVIFQTVSSSADDLEPHEPALLVEILASLCGQERYLGVLQQDRNLLIHTGVVLINLHKLGQTSDNCFSSIPKLAEMNRPSEEIAGHPAFGFKAGLVRIVGNMCWKNGRNQDLVREAELIPILLDCCNMDARNPLIMQWAIFAIRNLCENNAKNQALIAGLRQQGTVSSSTLEEMGLTVHGDGNNSIKIVPLDVLKKQ